MAVDIPVQKIPGQGSIDDITLTAADAGLAHEFVNSGNELLYIVNADASSKTTTIVSVPDSLGRIQDDVITTLAGGFSIAGPFVKSAWNQSTGVVNVNISDDTSLSFALIRPEPRL